MAVLRQFGLLLWKNYLLQKRKVLLTVFEVLLPCVLAALLILIRTRIVVENFPDGKEWQSFQVDTLPKDLLPLGRQLWPPSMPYPWQIAHAPKNDITDRIVLKAKMNLRLSVTDLGYENEEKLVKHFMDANVTSDNLAGVVFTNHFGTQPQLPDTVSYKLRFPSTQRNGASTGGTSFIASTDWLTEFLYPRFQRPEPRNRNNDDGGSPGYRREGFLALQLAVDRAIIEEFNKSANAKQVAVKLRRFPYPSYIRDPFVLVLQRQLPFILLLSFMIVAPSITKDIVLEKERKLKETMKMMGLHNWLHWTAWFVKYLLFLLITVLLITILFYVPVNKGSIIQHSHPLVIFIFLLFYCICTISFCFAVSTFFSKANSGAAAGGILFLVSYVPYFFMQNSYETLSFAAKFFPSLLHNVAMAMGCVQIALFEGSGEGLQFHNLGRPISVDDNFTMGHVLGLFALDTAIYLLITWYIDAVFPGKFGIPKPWYFACMKSYWCGKEVKIMNSTEDTENPQGYHQDPDFFEKIPPGQRIGVSIRNLRKEFKTGKTKKVAVAGMSLDVFEGQITALLGHNGAGKTTTMSILTGFLPPTSGTAYVNGYDITQDIESVRSNLGLCPQHDVLFDSLTVREHLVFFGKLKGLEGDEVTAAVNDMISLLKLEAKRDVASSKLSGGMKRKLSVGIALIGDSKMVILDEPTSGMDPEARRQIWDILQSQRQGRTMILTTHFMDEADYLGDRIAIMAEGVVKCFGSSLFLKSKYGVGYHMGIVKEPSCDVSYVTGIVKKYVPEAQLESNIGADLSYVLPQESSNRFEEMFTFLEQNKAHLGISSYGASVTTLEEVFLKVGESVDDTLAARLTHESDIEELENGYTNSAFDGPQVQEKQPLPGSQPYIPPTDYQTPDVEGEIAPTRQQSVFGTDRCRNTGFKWYRQQFYAMFVKRVLHSWRNRLITLTQLLIPLGFTIIACVVLKTLPTADDNAPALELVMNHFQQQRVPYITVSKYAAQADRHLAEHYKSFMTPRAEQLIFLDVDSTYSGDTSLQRYIKDIGKNSIATYNNRYVVGAVFDSVNGNLSAGYHTVTTAGFNNQGYHAPAISLSMLTNTILRYLAGGTKVIKTTNQPLPKTASEKIEENLNSGAMLGFIISYNVMFGMAFLIATFAVFLIKERVVKAKHVQFVSGVHSVNFWLSTFAWDIINYMIPSVLLIVVFAAFQIEAYSNGNNGGYVLLIFVLYGWAVIPLTYLLSLAFSVAATGYVWLSVLNIFFGTAGVLAVVILKIPDLGTKDIADALEWVFYLILPNYAFGQGLSDIYTNYQTLNTCKNPEFNIAALCDFLKDSMVALNITNPCCPDNCGDRCASYVDDYFAWASPGIGRPVLFLMLQGLVFFGVLFLIESRLLESLWQRATAGRPDRPVDDEEELQQRKRSSSFALSSSRFLHEDDDVAVERERIASTPLNQLSQSENLVLVELKKFYGQFLSVDRLSVGIPKGECFGLLGVNGAGKTTTFKMLTGDETISGGTAYLDGFNVISQIKKVQQRLGYCPQFDALIEQMTVEETLYMYGRLRGLPNNDIPRVVEDLIKSLLLEPHANKLAGDLSGGNKRKLNAAIALIGDPPIVFLDEPTTGMDPMARRLLWDTLCKVRASGRTLILTSHSMEECEALCNRLAIMVNGQFKCLGSPQHLKAKFGRGYTLMAKIHIPEDSTDVMDNMKPFMDYVEQTFPGCILKDMHQGLVNYQVSSTGTTWASIFGTMEKAKDRFHIDDYSVSQTTLEQVFLNFARAQIPPSEEKMQCSTKCTNCCCYFCCCGCCSQD